MEGNIIVMQDIFVYNKKGVAEDGRVIGNFIATGVRPKFADKLMVSGIQLPTDIFDK
jgi:pilus assembly protein CpaF